jgi:hypothetical protein
MFSAQGKEKNNMARCKDKERLLWPRRMIREDEEQYIPWEDKEKKSIFHAQGKRKNSMVPAQCTAKNSMAPAQG